MRMVRSLSPTCSVRGTCRFRNTPLRLMTAFSQLFAEGGGSIRFHLGAFLWMSRCALIQNTCEVGATFAAATAYSGFCAQLCPGHLARMSHCFYSFEAAADSS